MSGVKRRSGRYEYGSGEIPYQHEPWFTWMQDVQKRRAAGVDDKEIAQALGIKTTELRELYGISRNRKNAADSALAWKWKEKGWSNEEIAKRLGYSSEGSVRNLLKAHEQIKENKMFNTAEALKKSVSKNNMIDIGEGTECYLGVTQTMLNKAVRMLKQEGYVVENIQVEQVTNPGQYTTMKVLAPPGMTKKDIWNNIDKVNPVEMHSNDAGETFNPIQPPVSISSKRIGVNYESDKDGVVELRRGVEDISLGDSKYAQVRIAVDGTHYIKGMAVYNDNLPKGVDIVVNTNKKEGTPLLSDDPDAKQVLKPMKKEDPANPFGAQIKLINGQREYIDPKTGEKKLSVINKVNDEGDWGEWKKHIASQMLAKQDPKVVEQQLNLSYDIKKEQFDQIMHITNPAVKQKLLLDFAGDCDKTSVHLEAISFPRQNAKVILPLTTLKDNEIYAPTYKNGEKVILIRFPHGGKFEIPELVVNNGNKEGKAVITNAAKDAVGINKKVADRLSGADFDGDTVLVIPNPRGALKSQPPLKGLEGFDTKAAYPGYEGMKVLKNTQKEMGMISNLITDMTIKGANEAELARAVRHSMVIIDAKKHKLNYKQSFEDNQIKELYELYSKSSKGGASTLLSRAKSEKRVPQRDLLRTKIDPKTGELIYKETGKTYDKYKKLPDGSFKLISKDVPYQTKSTQMAETKDAFTLSTGTVVETHYANYANRLKALANEARKEAVHQPSIKYSPTAHEAYKEEVKSLNEKLITAIKNKPLERKAQRIADQMYKAYLKTEEGDRASNDDKKKARQRFITTARSRLGTTSRKYRYINITPKEWEAIQAGAVTHTKLQSIIRECDTDVLRSYSMPKDRPAMSSAQVSTAKSMLNRGYTIEEIADHFGVSTSTVTNYT